MLKSVIFLSLTLSSLALAKDLVIYSARSEPLIRPLLEKYEKQTGIKVKLLTDKAGPLLQKLKLEGGRTPADVFITVDAGNLYLAEQMNLLAPTKSVILNKNIPTHLRSKSHSWFGFSIRARSLFYNPKKVKRSQLSSYEDLGSQKWKNKLCLRTSKKVYNKSLVATMMSHLGEMQAEKVVRSWVKNLATDVFSSDTKLLKAIESGQCEVGIANTYYYGRLIKKDPQINVKIFWPNQSDRGVHINISGAGVIRASKNQKEAKRFLEWLSRGEAQKLFADANMEYPVNEGVEWHPIVKKLGSFKKDTISLTVAGQLQAKATRLMDRSGYK